jgi:hypothetical protein
VPLPSARGAAGRRVYSSGPTCRPIPLERMECTDPIEMNAGAGLRAGRRGAGCRQLFKGRRPRLAGTRASDGGRSSNLSSMDAALPAKLWRGEINGA